MFKISSQAKFNKTKFVSAITALSKMHLSIQFPEDMFTQHPIIFELRESEKLSITVILIMLQAMCDVIIYRRQSTMQYTVHVSLSAVEATFSILYN
jgi:hypothetical protein